MLRKPPASPKEYKDLLRRRKWWIVIPIAIVPVLVFLISIRLPRQYRSETLILVEPQKIPTEYVRATVTSDATDRLETIGEEMMSRTRLQRIVHDLGLYKEAGGTVSDDALVARMRKDITVNVIGGDAERHSIGAFKIAYVASTPQMAQKVTRELANLFIQENVKERGELAQGTSAFIEDEMRKAHAALDQQEAKIRQFKAAHMGTLPEQEASNLSLISQYQSLIQTNSEAIDRASQQKVYLQSMLNISGGDKPGVLPAPRTALQIQLEQKREELDAARQKYTDSHPDVIRLRSEVAALEAKANRKPSSTSPSAAEAPLPGLDMGQQLQSQLVAIDQEIKSRTARQHELEAQLAAVQGRIEVLPAVQSEFADLNRDYQDLQSNYQSLVEKQQSSAMAAELERHDEGEQFRILDPANLPGSPAEPNLILVNTAGAFGAIILGLLLAMIAEMRDATLHNAEDLERYLAIPLIVAVPDIPKITEKEWSKRRSLTGATT